jgi:hypothetical protein
MSRFELEKLVLEATRLIYRLSIRIKTERDSCLVLEMDSLSFECRANSMFISDTQIERLRKKALSRYLRRCFLLGQYERVGV